MMDWYLSDTRKDTSKEDLEDRAQLQIERAWVLDACADQDGDAAEPAQWLEVAECFEQARNRLVGPRRV